MDNIETMIAAFLLDEELEAHYTGGYCAETEKAEDEGAEYHGCSCSLD